MSKSFEIKGLKNLEKTFSNPEKLAKDFIDKSGGIEIVCPKCKNKVKVPTSGTICSCGQKIDFETTN